MRLCSALKKTSEQQQQEPAKIMQMSVHELVEIYEKGRLQEVISGAQH
jgi:hypothetical protein